MGAHWAVALERAAGVAVAGVGEGVVLDLVVPRLHQLKDGSIPEEQTSVDSQQFIHSGGGILRII